MTQRIELVEHAPATGHPLPAAIGQALAATSIVTASPDPYTPGRWLLRAGSKVGAFSISTSDGAGEPVTVRIMPKVPIARLFFLLGYSINPGGSWREEHVEVGEQDGVLPALAYAVERQIGLALRPGLLQGYRPVAESAMLVRGRIREADQIRKRFGAVLPVEITHDEFTTDVAENRILRGAVERLLRLTEVPSDVRRRLLHHRARLAKVTPPVPGQPIPAWQPSRLNIRYQPALHLARAVLEGMSPEHTTGELRINGFLFDMNRLFEDFVTVSLRESLRGTGLTGVLQDSQHLDEAGLIRMKPDFVLYGPAGVPVAVADAKYKAEKRAGYPDSDLYQMLAYCTALGLSEGHLVYAKGNGPHTAHQVRHTGVVLHQHALELDQAPTGLLTDIAALADRMGTGPTA
ncbi:McrC family protein [Nocardiopsis ansamitocini]|uniref:McrBC 5-methylcytosine restriction system component n=1 Tax=Nocardiopsis ansamitocini TaxID=1670832 RepID=A0A9W6UHM0_9ACTN|nr:hypothetical protein [Nocardiopsis ansamitocini]GLU49006.1 McrBC 5-methylcytosine restriction system component [Nocardiopsis ansamitocini]